MKDYTSSKLMDFRLSFEGIYKELDCVEQKMMTSWIRASVEKTDNEKEMKKLVDEWSVIRQILQAVKIIGIQALEEWRKKLNDTDQDVEEMFWDAITQDEEEMCWDAITQAEEETKRKRLVYMKQLHLMTDEDMEQTLKDINQAEEEKWKEWLMCTEQAEEELRKGLVNTEQQLQLETEEEMKKMLEDVEQLLLKAEDNETKHPLIVDLIVEQGYVEFKKLLRDNEQAEDRRRKEWMIVFIQVKEELIRTSRVYVKQTEKRKRIKWLSYIQQAQENRMKLPVYFEQVVEEWEKDHPNVLEKVVEEWEKDHPNVFEKVEETSRRKWLTNMEQSERERRWKWQDNIQLVFVYCLRKRELFWASCCYNAVEVLDSMMDEPDLDYSYKGRRTTLSEVIDSMMDEPYLDYLYKCRRTTLSEVIDSMMDEPYLDYLYKCRRTTLSEVIDSMMDEPYLDYSYKGRRTTLSVIFFKEYNKRLYSIIRGGTTMSEKKEDKKEPDSSKGGGTTTSEEMFRKDKKELDSSKSGGTTMSENMIKKDNKEPDSSKGEGTTMSEKMFKTDKKELDSSKGGGTTMSETMFAVDNNHQDLPKGEGTAMSVIDMLLCKICYMNELDVVFLPCSHMVACSRCAAKLKCCAVCRADIKEAIPAYLR